MQKKISWLVIVSMLLAALSGCGGKAQVRNVDWNAISGTWSEEGLGWEYGGMVLDIGLLEGEEDGGFWVDICLNLVQAAPASRYAEIYSEVDLDEMTWPVYTSEFEDSWGNTGTFTLTFGEDSIECVIGEDMEYDPYASWGVYPGTYTLVRNDSAWDDLSYDMEEYYERYPEQGMEEYEDPAEATIRPTGDWIEKGGIRYDDIRTSMAVSMDQLVADIESEEILGFEYRLVDVLPITGEYAHYINGVADDYWVMVHAYVSKEQQVYEAKFRVTYSYNDIGGWQYSADTFYKYTTPKEVNESDFYTVSGRKLSDFSYDDYPNGSPVSLGEIADDILYGKHNIFSIYDDELVSDIKTIDVIKGNYWSGEYAEYLTLVVKASLTNSLYDSEVEYELDYQNFAAGGWELSHTGDMVKEEKHTPKVITYSDEEFLAAAPPYFHEITVVESREFTNEKGEATKTIDYAAKREFDFLTELYDITLEATFKGNDWREKVNVDLVGADYSKIIGTWEGESNGEIIRLTVINMTLDATNDTGTIAYLVDTSLVSEENNQSEVDELYIRAGYFPYRENNVMQYHEERLAWFTSKANEGVGITFEIYRDKGIVASYRVYDTGKRGDNIELRKTL